MTIQPLHRIRDLNMARLIASQIALNRYSGEYDPTGGKAGCGRASEWDGAYARCSIRFRVCCQEHRAVHIKRQGDRNQMFGGISGMSFDHWAVYDTPGHTLRSPVAKVPSYLVEGYLAHMMPTRVDLIADSTREVLS